MIAVLLSDRRRTTRAQLGRMLLLLGGLASNAVADSAFTYLTANGSYHAIGSILDVGWVIGYLLIALAPLWPAPARESETEEGPIQLWQMALPWMAVLAAALAAISIPIRNQPIDQFETILPGSIRGLFVCNQILTNPDSLY